MYEQTNTMMETKTLFQIPQLLDGDAFTSEDLADDMEGLRLSFTRIKIPGGGHLQFEIPSGNPDVPDYAPYSKRKVELPIMSRHFLHFWRNGKPLSVKSAVCLCWPVPCGSAPATGDSILQREKPLQNSEHRWIALPTA